MRPTFRPDLICSREEQQGVVFYRVDDPKSETNFRLYEIEYLIATKLDGSRSLDEVIAAVRSDYSFDISDTDLNRFVSQLDAMGFLLLDSAKVGEETSPMLPAMMSLPEGPTMPQVATAPIDLEVDHAVDKVEMERLLRSALLHVKQGYIVHARDYFLAARELDPTDDRLTKLVSHLEIIGDSSGPAEVEYLWDQAHKLFPTIVNELGAVIDAKSGGPQAEAPGPQMARRATTSIEMEETLKHRLVWLLVALVVAIGGGGGLYYFARKGGVFVSPTEARVVTLEATKIPLYYPQSATSIRPLKEQDVGFADRGSVEDIKVKQGDHVQAGDVLATLELPPVQQKQIDTVKTFIGKLQSQYDKIAVRVTAIDEERKTAEEERDTAVEKIRELQPKLLLNQGVTVRDINQQKMARNMAVKKLAMIAKKGKPPQNQASAMSAKLQLAKNRLRTLEQGLSNHVVKAPFAGNIVSPVTVKKGDQVSSSTKLLTLRDESEAVLSFDIPGKVALKVGDGVLISVDGGSPAKGKVSVTADKDASTHIELGIPDPSGMFAMMAPEKFRIVREEIEQAFRIPTSAIAKSEADAKTRVFVATQGRAVPRDIEILDRDAAHAVIRDASGALKDGDKIVAATVETGDVSGITDGTFLKTTE